VRRRALLLSASLLLLPACAGSEGQQVRLPQARPVTRAGLDLTSVQRAVNRFLGAYAQSSRDIEPLERAVGGEELQEWVYWLEIQNRDNSLDGVLEVHRVRVLEIQGDFAAVGVDATVHFTLPDGSTFGRRFESPVLLAKQGPGEAWVVIDAVRDGRSMQDAIGLIRPPAMVIQNGITVEVPSVFRFTPGTVVNIRVTNDTGRAVRLSASRSTLVSSGIALPGRATNRELRGPIPPGGQVEGMVEFDQIPLEQPPRVFELGFEGEAPIAVQLPPEAFAVGVP
jgi:hypothetical protein